MNTETDNSETGGDGRHCLDSVVGPCPFCGSTSEFNPSLGCSTVGLHNYNNDAYRVECGRCGTMGPCYDDHERAIAVWNKAAHREGLLQASTDMLSDAFCFDGSNDLTREIEEGRWNGVRTLIERNSENLK
jgi:hypothetical protein